MTGPNTDSAPAAETPAPDRAPGGLVRLIVIALVVTLAAVGYRNLVHPNIFPKRFGVVVPGSIYRSGKLTTAALTKVVRENDIKTVVDLGAWVEPTEANRRANAREQAASEALGVERHVFQLTGDARGDPKQYAEALKIVLDPANQPVLVHCGAGTERTGCLVAMYRMYHDGLSLDEAYAEAEKAGHSGGRNPHLREVLETWSGPVLESVRTGEPIRADHTTEDPGDR
ncbi:MAG: tyrosine-protein phosphatase [Phycisphaerales bacterium JB054]